MEIKIKREIAREIEIEREIDIDKDRKGEIDM